MKYDTTTKASDAPWTAKPNHTGKPSEPYRIEDGNGCTLALVVDQDPEWSEGDPAANARLLAAAPDLLRALQACQRAVAAWVDSGSADDRDFEACKLAKAAIEKAVS